MANGDGVGSTAIVAIVVLVIIAIIALFYFFAQGGEKGGNINISPKIETPGHTGPSGLGGGSSHSSQR